MRGFASQERWRGGEELCPKFACRARAGLLCPPALKNTHQVGMSLLRRADRSTPLPRKTRPEISQHLIATGFVHSTAVDRVKRWSFLLLSFFLPAVLVLNVHLAPPSHRVYSRLSAGHQNTTCLTPQRGLNLNSFSLLVEDFRG